MAITGQSKEPRRIAFISKFLDKRNVLFLYGNEEARRRMLENFLACGEDAACFYAYPGSSKAELRESGAIEVQLGSSSRWNFSRASETIGGNLKSKRGRLLNDFCCELSDKDVEDFLGYLEELKKLQLCVLNAFDASRLSEGTLEKLLKAHEHAIVSLEGETSVVFPSHLAIGKAAPIEVKFISQKSMEKLIKRSLEVIVLSMLDKKPMSGFEIIKAVIRNFGILINQGMVYPLLHSLERHGYIAAHTSEDKKVKQYSLTAPGRSFARERVMEYAMAQKMILDMVLQR